MKKIRLTQGKFALVDDEDWAELTKYNWFAMRNPRGHYASRQTGHGKGNQKLQAMHRFLLGLTNPKIVAHHRDGNGLNNQRANLETRTPRQNMWSRKKYGRTSKYVGVSRASGGRYRRFQASIRDNRGGRIHLGNFATEIEAAMAWNKLALKFRGKFATLNPV